MKSEEQVLSAKQVQELQELGFDIEKYASMCWFEQTPFAPIEQPKKYELEILTYSLMGNRGYLEVIPTLTIGDIMEILPEEIIVKDEDCDLFTYEFNIIKNSIYYYEFDINDDIYSSGINKTFIDALFETLKWCIKEKHIAL